MYQPRPGDVLKDRYRLERELGRGGFGAVWRARDMASDTWVAVKLLREPTEEAARRFAIEARALTQLNHPYCVRCLDFGEQPFHFLVMSYHEGLSLREWATRRTVDEITRLGRKLAEGLTHAHQRGVLHRDLKPENIIVVSGPDGDEPVLLDFGLAKIVGTQYTDVTKTGEVVGTPGFMSPEQLRGLGNVGPQSDVYCLGVILFELFEGHPPYSGRSQLEIAMAHLAEPIPTMVHPDLPPSVRDLVLRMLAKSPDKRPASAQSVALALAEPHQRGRVQERDRRPALVAGALAIVAILSSVAWLLWPREASERVVAPHVPPAQNTLLRGNEPEEPEPAVEVTPAPQPCADMKRGLFRDEDVVVYVPSSLPRGGSFAHLFVMRELEKRRRKRWMSSTFANRPMRTVSSSSRPT